MTSNGDGNARQGETLMLFDMVDLPGDRTLLKAHVPEPDIKITMNLPQTSHPATVLLSILGWAYGNARAFARNEEFKAAMPPEEHAAMVALCERIITFVDGERPK